MKQLDTHELEWRLIYSIIVAGKSQSFADAAMERLGSALRPQVDMGRVSVPCGWFDALRQIAPLSHEGGRSVLEAVVRKARTGNYTKIEQALRALVDADLDLCTCTAEQLQTIHGIGPKTARFFILWTRPGVRYAALDVHVLRWLRQLGYDAPKTTPGSPKVYGRWEVAFLAEADKRGVTPRELDHAIWVEAAQHPERSARTAELVKPVEVSA